MATVSARNTVSPSTNGHFQIHCWHFLFYVMHWPNMGRFSGEKAWNREKKGGVGWIASRVLRTSTPEEVQSSLSFWVKKKTKAATWAPWPSCCELFYLLVLCSATPTMEWRWSQWTDLITEMINTKIINTLPESHKLCILPDTFCVRPTASVVL